jgi:hypothetical protein
MFAFLKKLVYKVLDYTSIFKHISDRYLSTFIDRELTIDDFTQGLFQRDLPLKVDTINERVLHSSPYMLYRGHIELVDVRLPAISDLAT